MIYLGYAALLCMGLMDNFRAPEFSNILNDLQLTHTQGSFLFVMTALVSFVSGWFVPGWVQRRGTVQVAMLGLMASAVTYGLLGYAAGVWSLAALAGLFGVGYGVVSVVENYLILEGSPPARHRQLLAGLHSMYALAALLAPAFAEALRALGFTWRDGFVILSALPMTVALVALLFRRRGHLLPACEPILVPSATPVPTPSEAIPTRTPVALSQWPAVVMLAGYLMAEIAISSRLPIYLEQDQHWSLSASRWALLVFCFLLCAGRLVLWWRPGPRTAELLLASAVVGVIFFVLGLTVEPLFLVVCGLAFSPFYPLAIDWMAQLFAARRQQVLARAVATGSLAVVVLHYSLGVLADLFSLRVGLMVGPTALAIAGGAVYWMRRQLLRPPTLPPTSGN